jgi:hypothetical protein
MDLGAVEDEVRWRNLEGAVDVFNVLGASWREGQFAMRSRLSCEPTPRTAMSFTPGWPRGILGP